LSFKSQELDNTRDLFKHNDDTLKKSNKQLDKALNDISERDRKLNSHQVEFDQLKNELKNKHNELRNTSKFLEDNIAKIESHGVLEKQLQFKENSYEQLTNNYNLLTQELFEAQQKIQEYTNYLEHIEHQNKNLKSDVDSKLLEVRDLEKNILLLKNEYTRITTEKDDLQEMCTA